MTTGCWCEHFRFTAQRQHAWDDLQFVRGFDSQFDASITPRFHLLLGMPRVFQHPRSRTGADADPEVSRLASRKNAQTVPQVVFQSKIGCRCKPRVQNRGPLEAVELPVPQPFLSRRNLLGRGDNVQTRLIEHDRVGLDTPSSYRAAGRLIIHLHDAMLQDRSIERLQETLLSSVGLGGHAQHIQDAAVFFVVLGHGRRQFVTHLVPERFNALPERRAKQRVEQITA